jgi:hypothetical protein
MRWRRIVGILACAGGLAGPALGANSTINTTNKWIWASGAGWINCRSSVSNGLVIGQYVCSGWGYSATAGWIGFGKNNPTNNMYYLNLSTNDYGVNHDGEGRLTGYAWCESTGWINFQWTNKTDALAPKVDLQTGMLSGYAWGSGIGWLSLTNLSARLETDSLYAGRDRNTNGIPDAWELLEAGSTNLLEAGASDYDGDGVYDYDEYIAGTCPTNENEFLSVTNASYDAGSTNLVLAWPGEVTRFYKVETNACLTNAAGWASAGTWAGTGSTMQLQFTPDSSQMFFRVKALLPPLQ